MNRLNFRWQLALLPLAAVGCAVLVNRGYGVEPEAPIQLATLVADAPVVAPQPDVLPDWHADVKATEFKYVGAAGCSAANCHGGDALKGTVGSEHSIWMQKDPHADAYAVLRNETSARIMEYLAQSKRYADLDGVPAWEAKICLDCHAAASDRSQLAAGHKFSLRDGVSCEGCHGAAEKWLDPHKRWDWKFLSPEQKSSLGFVNTEDLYSRSKMCAECHVGAADREVNHDIMAGGHPRLNFEMAAFSSVLPPHWNPNDDRRRHAVSNPNTSAENVHSAYFAKLWALGQVAAAEKSLELLETRAGNEDRVWPEFTEYGCYACHHDLQPSAWRQQARGYDLKPGHFPYGTWQFAALPILTKDTMASDLFAKSGAFEELRKEMGKPAPNRQRVVELSAPVRKSLAELGHQINNQPMSSQMIEQLLTGSTNDGQTIADNSWDAASQVYLAAVATYQAMMDANGRIARPIPQDLDNFNRFRTIRKQLKFPHPYDSPRTFEESTQDRVDVILEQLKELSQAIPK